MRNRKELAIVKRCEVVKISGDAFKAVIFDLDGVVTYTAGLHAASWKKMFDAFLEKDENVRFCSSTSILMILNATVFTMNFFRRKIIGCA
jgi:phosphoglycolate phosphatase-like HAD superfamily hydrolase